MTSIPDTLEGALTPDWLTTALEQRYPGTIVEAVEVRKVLHGVGTKALISLRYKGDDEGPVPTELCLKAGYEPHNRHLLEGGTYLKEARFYGLVADELPVVKPTCYYAGFDLDSKQGVLLLQDLYAAGVSFGSAQQGYRVDDAVKFVEALAALHARHWGGEVVQTHPWLQVAAMAGASASIYTDRLQTNLEDGRADTLPAELRDASRLVAASRALAGIIEHTPACLVHGDPHAGNLYLTSSGEPGFYDWQTVQVAPWAIDVPYYLCASLSHEDRRRSIRDLLQHYLDSLASHGVAPPSWDEAWLAYRRFLMYGLFLWAITRPVVQPVEVINAFVDKLGHAAVEAETFEALGA